MRITSVDIIMLKEAGASLTAYPIRPVICRINTDEGIYGYGEAGISTGRGENAAYGILMEMCRFMIGRDPMDNEVVWNELLEKCCGHISGGGVVVFSGMSAIDTALMDIKGKALGIPVYQLLGGKANSKLHCYASQLQQGWNGDWGPRGEAREYARICQRAMDDGFDAVKINFVSFDKDKTVIDKNRLRGPLGKDIYNLVDQRLLEIRKACGDELKIIAELFCQTDITSAAVLDKIFREYDVLFAEEATHTFNLELFKRLSEKMSTPLSSGERIHTRFGFHQLLEQYAVSIIQPDICNCGGISEAKKICDMAKLYDVCVQAHVCGSPIAEAAAYQLEASLSNFYIHEYMFLSRYSESYEYGKYHYEPAGGYIKVPDLPGIGQEISEKSLNEAKAITVIK